MRKSRKVSTYLRETKAAHVKPSKYPVFKRWLREDGSGTDLGLEISFDVTPFILDGDGACDLTALF